MTDSDRDTWLGIVIGAVLVLVLLKRRKSGCGCGPATVLPFTPRGTSGGAGGVVVVDRCAATPMASRRLTEGGFGNYAQGAGPESPVEFHG